MVTTILNPEVMAKLHPDVVARFREEEAKLREIHSTQIVGCFVKIPPSTIPVYRNLIMPEYEKVKAKGYVVQGLSMQRYKRKYSELAKKEKMAREMKLKRAQAQVEGDSSSQSNPIEDNNMCPDEDKEIAPGTIQKLKRAQAQVEGDSSSQSNPIEDNNIIEDNNMCPDEDKEIAPGTIQKLKCVQAQVEGDSSSQSIPIPIEDNSTCPDEEIAPETIKKLNQLAFAV